MLTNIKNYGRYSVLAQTGFQEIHTSDLSLKDWITDISSIINIMKDGIEEDSVHNMIIRVVFVDGEVVELSLFDYYINLILWQLFMRVNEPITSYHLFFEDDIKKKSLKKYIDDKFIDRYRKLLSNFEMNNIIDDSMYQFSHIDTFSMYLCNTFNIEDMIDLMEKYPEVYDIIHSDLSNIPIEDVKKKGNELTNKLINYIKHSDHCAADCFRAGEAINPKQFKEVFVNIGPKPDGNGSIFPTIVNKNFVNGGVNDLASFHIESSGGRTAQIIAKINVGTSGHFARLLGLNNRDSVLHLNPEYDCHTKNYEIVTIDDEATLKLFGTGRYYRLHPDGMEYKLTKNDKHLIGKTIYLRSPMTCASKARGNGICYKCYGDLAYTNRDINIGQIASELLSSVFTQKQLSAKHLLESSIIKTQWVKEFNEYLDLVCNVIKLKDDFDYRGYHLLIDPEAITSESDEDDYEYNEYITSFEIMTPLGKIIPIFSMGEELTNMYITNNLNEKIRFTAEADIGAGKNRFSIPMEGLQGEDILLIHLTNDELSSTLNKVKTTLNQSKTTCSFDRNQILQEFIRINLKGGLDLCAVHAEVILSNQIRSKDNILLMPDWDNENEPYQIITLNQALTDNPSCTVSLEYQKLAKALYNPLTFKKHGKSFCDLFFMEKPQEFFSNKNLVAESTIKSDKDEINKPLITFDQDKFKAWENSLKENKEVDINTDDDGFIIDATADDTYTPSGL